MPEKIGQYTIVSQLGRGGMGVVYKARDESLNRFVAIKVLNEQLTEDATFLQRFVREAQAAPGLSPPNIVQIFFIGKTKAIPTSSWNTFPAARWISSFEQRDGSTIRALPSSSFKRLTALRRRTTRRSFTGTSS